MCVDVAVRRDRMQHVFIDQDSQRQVSSRSKSDRRSGRNQLTVRSVAVVLHHAEHGDHNGGEEGRRPGADAGDVRGIQVHSSGLGDDVAMKRGDHLHPPAITPSRRHEPDEKR